MKQPLSTLLAGAWFATLLSAASAGEADLARSILDATGVKGGLIVHLGCGDGALTLALQANDSYLVQGLDADAGAVEKAQAAILAAGRYGPVTIARWSGPLLPYRDNLVNLLVAEDAASVPPEEIMRVLCPRGVAYVKRNGAWTATVKPRPPELDEWTHYLHDASNNAVAHDTAIGPPRQMQWLGGPRYSRHHDHMSAISALVSANGRNFSIFDEGTHASILLAPHWSLVGRDAFNGMILWKRPIPEWHSTLWPLKSGPQLLTRRLVAIGDRVYVTLGLNAPLSVLDAATGAILHTYEGTAVTEEILHAGGRLFLVVNPHKEPAFATFQAARTAAGEAWPDEGKRRILAVQPESGQVLWEKLDRILPETLAVEGGRVFYHDGEKMVCLDAERGAPQWASPPLSRRSIFQSFYTPTLVAWKDVVLFSGGVDVKDFGGGTSPIVGLSAAKGSILWKAEQPPCGHHSPKDILVANGLAWFGDVAQSSSSGMMSGLDPETGTVVKHYPPDTKVPWFHHRCYRAKATDQFLLFSRTGIEFIDTHSGHWTPNNWVRGGCLYGIMPANGMVYSTPTPCACYEEAKLYGFTALAPAAKTPPLPTAEEARLLRGPGYAALQEARPAVPDAADWSTYRHDAARSGSTRMPLPEALKSRWQTGFGGALSSPTIAEGRVLVSEIEVNTVHALDAATGRRLWRFIAGGRVDSPPTLWQGSAIFGCADGAIYCLNAADGTLAWRFQAAPAELRMLAYERLESVWPVSGSVLVREGVVYAVAGRSMFLDGGLRLLRLDARSGRKLSETVLNDQDPGTKEDLQSDAKGMNMPVALPDILSCDGRYVYMRSLPFDLQGRRKFVEYIPVHEQKGDDVHLFSPTGFLDDTMWHRTYWVYGRAWASGAGGYYLAGRLVPAGRIMVFDDTTVWGYGRLAQYYRWSTPYQYHVFASDKQPEVLKASARGEGAGAARNAENRKKGSMGEVPAAHVACRWSTSVAVQARALVHAGERLYVAGPPDLLNEEEAAKTMDDPKVQARLAEQEAALQGRKGALIWVLKEGGEKLSEVPLESPPVWDGMAAANGCLFLSSVDHKVSCLGRQE